MLFINQPYQDPRFNLASEEYMLETSCEDVFMLWRNGPSVIIGKNQNAYAEVNTSFTEARGIQVIRRLTGGGAVFHDAGNLNYTFITDAEESTAIDFARFCAPIIDALKQLGVQAALDGRNDLLVDGRKISGNAQCVYHTKDGRKRLMHHGTLLFSADMSQLVGALQVHAEKIESKGIKSVRSRVANIRDLNGYTGPSTIEGFLSALDAYAAAQFGASRDFTKEEKDAISTLVREKYSTWEWNFGKSGEYHIQRQRRFDFGTVSIELNGESGVIGAVAIRGDYFGTADTAELESHLLGCRLEGDALRQALKDCGKYISGSTPGALAELILGNTVEK